jgi:DnaJ-class molecular chaperone with C-terminal Zn finger domain
MEKIIPKMGFSGKGSLIIKIEVLFPKSLSADTKQRLQNILT